MNNEIMPRRSTPELFTRLPLFIVLPSAAAGTAAGTTAIALHADLSVATGIGLAVAALGAVRIRKTNVWRILGMRIALRWRNRRGNAIGARTEPFEVTLPESGGARCGMRWDGSHLITMLALERTGVRPTLLSSAEIRADAAVSLADIARCLAQFDIRLAAVDVVTLGVRTQGPDNVVRVYEKLLGPLPAAAAQTVWLVLRFDPLDNVGAIDNRGSGQEGMVRTALVATRRVAARLATRGVRVSVLTATELAGAEAAALHDTEPQQWTEDWRALRSDGIELAGYAVRPERLDAEALAAVWALPGKSVLTRLRLTPAPGSAATQRDNTVALTALVRQDKAGAGHHDADTSALELGLLPLRGRQRRVLLDGRDLDTSVARCGTPATMSDFAVPAGGCGQVIGATSDGFGVAVSLFGPEIRQVEIVGSLWLTQLMILRAIAVGAQVIVHTTRPQEWAHLVAAVDAPAALSVSSPGGAAHHTAAATMIVYDGVAATGQVSEATAVQVRSQTTSSSVVLGADVALIGSASAPGTVIVRTKARELVVQVVSIPEETEYLGTAETATESVLQPA